MFSKSYLPFVSYIKGWDALSHLKSRNYEIIFLNDEHTCSKVVSSASASIKLCSSLNTNDQMPLCNWSLWLPLKTPAIKRNQRDSSHKMSIYRELTPSFISYSPFALYSACHQNSPRSCWKLPRFWAPHQTSHWKEQLGDFNGQPGLEATGLQPPWIFYCLMSTEDMKAFEKRHSDEKR